ncbi:hypothetical protein C4559_03765 [Candidatus Microgenomates bacterium]|nr:MAG: hypothetical protein C4559_03765 [Candidatus Microgenomates bacterium]
MAFKCENCKKGTEIGRQHKHHPGIAGQRWKKRAPQTVKVFKPNLHMARVVVNGVSKRMKLCTKCTRLLKGKSTPIKSGSTMDLKKAKESAPLTATL